MGGSVNVGAAVERAHELGDIGAAALGSSLDTGHLKIGVVRVEGHSPRDQRDRYIDISHDVFLWQVPGGALDVGTVGRNVLGK